MAVGPLDTTMRYSYLLHTRAPPTLKTEIENTLVILQNTEIKHTLYDNLTHCIFTCK